MHVAEKLVFFTHGNLRALRDEFHLHSQKLTENNHEGVDVSPMKKIGDFPASHVGSNIFVFFQHLL